MKDRTSVRDKPRPGRPAEAVTPTMVANVAVVFLLLFFFGGVGVRGWGCQ